MRNLVPSLLLYEIQRRIGGGGGVCPVMFPVFKFRNKYNESSNGTSYRAILV